MKFKDKYICTCVYMYVCIYSPKPAPPERIPWAKLRAEQAEREAARWEGKTKSKLF